MEILGLVEPSSPNPRRNTSKSFFELLRSGNKAATCCCFVATLLPLFPIRIDQEATNRQHVAAPKTHIFNEDADYDAREAVSI